MEYRETRKNLRGGFSALKIEPPPGGTGDGDLMSNAIINYSKHLIMGGLHDTVAQTHARTHAHMKRATVASQFLQTQ